MAEPSSWFFDRKIVSRFDEMRNNGELDQFYLDAETEFRDCLKKGDFCLIFTDSAQNHAYLLLKRKERGVYHLTTDEDMFSLFKSNDTGLD